MSALRDVCAAPGCLNIVVAGAHCAEHKRRPPEKLPPLVERDPETQAVHDRHPNIKQKPLPLDEVTP
jgi:hypothetical protein